MNDTHILVQTDHAVSVAAPSGYLAWHEWAQLQSKAGLKQVACGRCGKWNFPQELALAVDRNTMQGRKGPVAIQTPVCSECSNGFKDGHN